MLLPEPARALLRKKAWGQVVTLNPDGAPQVTMVWVDEDGGDLVFNTALDRRKAMNLQRDPRITVAVQNLDAPQEYLVVRGRASLVTEGAREHLNTLSMRIWGRPTPTKEPPEERVIVRVHATRITGRGPWIDD